MKKIMNVSLCALLLGALSVSAATVNAESSTNDTLLNEISSATKPVRREYTSYQGRSIWIDGYYKGYLYYREYKNGKYVYSGTLRVGPYAPLSIEGLEY